MTATDTTNEAAQEYGEVFTRRWVVELILDLIGYTPDRDLATMTAVEPSCGSGAFIGPMVERLSESLRRHGRGIQEAGQALQVFDLLPHHVETCTTLAQRLLTNDGWDPELSSKIAHEWMASADYLLTDHPEGFADFVVGNPPYIRMDDMNPEVVATYRSRCSTMSGRTDIYIGFFEVGLRSLKPGGVLGYICADRWMRNQYGKQLRRLLSTSYNLATTIVAHDVDAFEEQVSAYPAITIITNEPQGATHLVTTTGAFDEDDARRVVSWLMSKQSVSESQSFSAARLPTWNWGEQSWPSGSPAQLALLEDLNERFGPLEDKATGTRIGIGVATGSDQVFVVGADADVEAERLLPLVMSRDTKSGQVKWQGAHLVNPWEPDGSLVELSKYPRLRRYFEHHRDLVGSRNVAKRDDKRWYRTIDKVEHSLTARPKLLFPDMKMSAHPTLEPGGLYPHHNLYFIVSDEWDLEVLGGLLLSKVAEFFISAYAVRMRGGTLRFQAQYLRRIRVPKPKDIEAVTAAALAEAFRTRDQAAATRAALSAYGLTELPT